MEANSAVFSDVNKANVRALLDALGSNLDPSNPVQFDWKEADMQYLYGEGQYVSHSQEHIDDACDDANLFDEQHVLDSLQRERPDGLKDPEAFAQAVEDGLINLQLVENVQKCILVVGKFYMQRPPVLDHNNPFNLVKVVKVVMNEDNKTQWGAWVHPWEISTTGNNVDYYKDPWHANGAYLASQRYNETKHMHKQAASWTYPLCVLDEFQDEVKMNMKWVKKKGFNKPVHAGHAILKRNLDQAGVPKVRNYVHRWNEEEIELAQEE